MISSSLTKLDRWTNRSGRESAHWNRQLLLLIDPQCARSHNVAQILKTSCDRLIFEICLSLNTMSTAPGFGLVRDESDEYQKAMWWPSNETKDILGEMHKHILHLTFLPKLESTSKLLNRGVWLVRDGGGWRQWWDEMRGIHYLRFRLSHAGPSLPISQTHLSIFNRHSDSAKFVFFVEEAMNIFAF